MDIQQKDEYDSKDACTQWCQSEFRSENIGLDHDQPQDFVTTQWPARPHVYLTYRLAMGVLLMVWVAGDIVYESEEFYGGESWRWFSFATNWSFLVVGLTAVLQTVTSFLYAAKPHWILDPVYQRSMPFVLKLQWILFNVSSTSALVVTVAYWGFIAYVSNARTKGEEVLWTWRQNGLMYNGTDSLLTSDMSRLKHTANSVYVITDVMVSGTPIRLYHYFFTVFLGSVYTVFNALYYVNNGSLMIRTGVALDGRDYYFMNWAEPVEAIITVVFAILLAALAQLSLHGLYKLRLWLCARVRGHRVNEDSELQNIVTSSNSYNSMEEAYGP